MVWESMNPLGDTIGDDRDILANRIRMPFDTTCVSDNDRDGFGAPGDGACPLGGTLDCDDDDLRVAPGAVQSCDGLNNDCTHPSWPELAATNEFDDDGDGLSECAGDCDDGDPMSWALPGEVRNLTLGRGEAGQSELQWEAPDVPGADPAMLVFDVLRSTAPFNCWRGFGPYSTGPQTCLASDDVDYSATDAEVPPPGQVFFYQVRAENGCPGTGVLGIPATHGLRQGLDCS
jgi:hypothetical protein